MGGCIGGGEPLPAVAPTAPVEADARRLRDLASALRAAQTPADRERVLTAALRSAGVAPAADAQVPGGEGRTYAVGGRLVGWVVGRQPVRRDTVVVVMAPRDGTSDLALIEAARLLVGRSAYTQTPERSVMVVLGDGPRVPRLWDRTRIRSVVAVGARPDSLDGFAVRSVPQGTDSGELAVRLFHVLVRETTPAGSIYTPAPDAPVSE